MAHQPPVGGMIGQRDAASGALRHFAAFPAEQHPAVAPPVQKQNTLFPGSQVLFQLLTQRLADGTGVSVPDFLPHVRDRYLRKGPLVIPAAQPLKTVDPLSGRPGALHRGCGGAQQQHGAAAGAAELCHLPGMIPGRIL